MGLRSPADLRFRAVLPAVGSQSWADRPAQTTRLAALPMRAVLLAVVSESLEGRPAQVAKLAARLVVPLQLWAALLLAIILPLQSTAQLPLILVVIARKSLMTPHAIARSFCIFSKFWCSGPRPSSA